MGTGFPVQRCLDWLKERNKDGRGRKRECNSKASTRLISTHYARSLYSGEGKNIFQRLFQIFLSKIGLCKDNTFLT